MSSEVELKDTSRSLWCMPSRLSRVKTCSPWPTFADSRFRVVRKFHSIHALSLILSKVDRKAPGNFIRN